MSLLSNSFFRLFISPKFPNCSFNFTMSGGGGASMADKDFAAADEDFDMMAFLALAT